MAAGFVPLAAARMVIGASTARRPLDAPATAKRGDAARRGHPRTGGPGPARPRHLGPHARAGNPGPRPGRGCEPERRASDGDPSSPSNRREARATSRTRGPTSMPAGGPEREIGAASPSSGRSSVKHRAIGSCGRPHEVGLDRAWSSQTSPRSSARQRPGQSLHRWPAQCRGRSARTRRSGPRPSRRAAPARLRPDARAGDRSVPVSGKSRTERRSHESARSRRRVERQQPQAVQVETGVLTSPTGAIS